MGSFDAAFSDGWLRISPLQPPSPAAIGVGLYPGETEALGLAVEKRAEVVLLDDGDARRRAAEIGMRFIGVLGVLLRARQAGRVPSLREEIRRLRQEARFFIAAKLEVELVVAAGENLPFGFGS